MATRHDLQRVLATHIGKDKGVTAEALARALDIPARMVRHLVTELREEGVAVCGHPSNGYFIAETPEELNATCKFLRGRAMKSLELESRLRKIPLPDLLGQLHLKT